MNDGDRRTDLSRLVQHVALNTSGWWKQAVQRLVLICVYTRGTSSTADIQASVSDWCGMPPNSSLVLSAINRLIASGQLIEFNGQLSVSESSRQMLVRQNSDVLGSEKNVRDRFNDMAQDRGMGDRTDELWSVMEEEVVLPIVKYMGARMYRLLTASSHGNNDLESQMSEFLSRRGDQVRSFLADFLDPHDEDVRQFVLRRLNAQYAIDAAALPRDALDRLAHLGQRTGRIDVLLDTNFLFSVLDLHDNPGDDLAKDLLNLVHKLQGRVDLNLYVLPDTVRESRTVLQATIANLEGFRGQPNLARAATRTNPSGLTRRYFEAASRAPQSLTAKAFFGPYESNLVTMLRSRSVELYNTDLASLRVAQEVIDDLHDEEERQQMYRQQGAKPYEANLHDMVLWHFAKSRRRAIVESPLDTTVWVVTLDHGLIRFDQRKGQNESGPPICLHPRSLIQLFQFWIPSSTTLDEALVSSVRHPLLFLNFDNDAERITTRILNQLSRYEGAEDLNPDIATEILTNQALRDRLSYKSDELSTDEQIIQDKLFEYVQRLGDGLQEVLAELDDDRDMIKRLEKRIADLGEASKEAANEREARIDADRNLAVEAAARHDAEAKNRRLVEALKSLGNLEDANQRLRQQLDEQKRRSDSKAENWQLGIRGGLTVLLAIFFGSGGFVLNRWLRSGPAWLASISMGLMILLFGLEVAVRRTRFQESFIVTHLPSVRSRLLGFLVTMFGAVFADWFLLD